MNLLSPDVYVQDIPSGSQTIPTTANLVGAMVGATRSGPVGEPVLISSFAEFAEKFANGLDTPYMSNSMLPYAVLGFYQNGGGQLNIVRVVSPSAKTAKTDVPGVTLNANNPGVWANDLKVTITKNQDWQDAPTTNTNTGGTVADGDGEVDDDLDGEVDEVLNVRRANLSVSTMAVEPTEIAEGEEYHAWDVTVSLGSSDDFTLTDIKTKEELMEQLASNYKFKYWFDTDTFAFARTYELAEGTWTFTGGADGVDDLTDTQISNSFSALDAVDDIVLMAVPGHTTKVLDRAIMDYCDSRKIHPILDMPKGSTVEEVRTYRKSISANGGALYYPWLIVNDPLTETLIKVPTAGHVMGLYCYFNDTRGLGKAPAGTTAIVRGAIDLEYKIKGTDMDILNPIGVCCIQERTNYGIVVWGARSLNSADTKMRYVTDIVINYVFHKQMYNGLQWAVFEPNDAFLWRRIRATLTAYLLAQYNNGVLQGADPESAFYVVCDETINTQDVIDAGICYTDVGYCPNKPAEFVVIRLAHDMTAVTGS